MMEDPLIEKNNGLNDMSADDGGSSDLDETEDEDFYDSLNSELPVAAETEVYDWLNSELPVAAGTEMMEDPLIENNGLNDMSADDGGSFDIKENKEEDMVDFLTSIINSQMISPPTVIAAAGTEGSDAFTTPLAQYKPHDNHSGIKIRVTAGKGSVGGTVPRRIRLTHKHNKLRKHNFAGDDDYLDEVSQMISPPTVIAEAMTDCYLNLGTASFVTARPRHTEQRSPFQDTRIYIPGGNDERGGLSKKMDFEWIFVITNVVLQSMSAIFTQLSSKQKPQYALLSMLLSYLALLTCIIELIYENHRHRQIPIRRRGKSFATLNNIVALACALGECVVTTINYRFDSPIKLTVLPIILANGLLFSKILKYRQRDAL